MRVTKPRRTSDNAETLEDLMRRTRPGQTTRMDSRGRTRTQRRRRQLFYDVTTMLALLFACFALYLLMQVILPE